MSAFIESQKAAGFAVELVCRTLGVSRSAHYERASGRRSARAVADERLVAVIRAGARGELRGLRLPQAAPRAAPARACEVGRDRVKRLMREHGIQGAKRRGKRWQTTTPDPHAGRRPDLVERDFTASGPDELYVADFTYLRCWEGAGVPGVRHRRLHPPRGRLAAREPHARLAGLRRAADGRLDPRRRGADVAARASLATADRNTRSLEFAQVLDDHDVLQSVGSVGDAYDNAHGRELRRHDQDRADRRSRLADPLPARARDRRVPRLVQPRAPARVPRRHPARRVRGPTRSALLEKSTINIKI